MNADVEEAIAPVAIDEHMSCMDKMKALCELSSSLTLENLSSENLRRVRSLHEMCSGMDLDSKKSAFSSEKAELTDSQAKVATKVVMKSPSFTSDELLKGLLSTGKDGGQGTTPG